MVKHFGNAVLPHGSQGPYLFPSESLASYKLSDDKPSVTLAGRLRIAIIKPQPCFRSDAKATRPNQDTLCGDFCDPLITLDDGYAVSTGLVFYSSGEPLQMIGLVGVMVSFLLSLPWKGLLLLLYWTFPEVPWCSVLRRLISVTFLQLISTKRVCPPLPKLSSKNWWTRYFTAYFTSAAHLLT